MRRMRRGLWAPSKPVLLNHDLLLFSESYYCHVIPWREVREKNLSSYPGTREQWSCSKLGKKVKATNDAIMTGILVTRFQMGQIDVNDLEKMAIDISKTERSSAARKVLAGIRDMPTILKP